MSLTGKPDLTTLPPIVNDGFWPDVSLADLLNNYRIPSNYADGVIKMGLLEALKNVNESLKKVKAQIMLTHATFELYNADNSEQLDGIEVMEMRYKHAVYSHAKAFLLGKQFKTVNRTEVAENEAKESRETYQEWMDESQKEIAFLIARFLPDEDHVLSSSGIYVGLI